LTRPSLNDLVDLSPLLQSYCEFYYQIEEIPRTNDELLLSVSRASIANPKQQGIQFLVRHVQDGKTISFATLFYPGRQTR
jgi:hypothetical protein